MENLFPDKLLQLLMISITFSTILMMVIQKIKKLSFISKSWQVWFLNLLFSFLLGIPFSMTFYGTDFLSSIWVGIFSFVGASGLYEALKKQTIINYRPISTSDNTSVLSEENEMAK